MFCRFTSTNGNDHTSRGSEPTPHVFSVRYSFCALAFGILEEIRVAKYFRTRRSVGICQSGRADEQNYEHLATEMQLARGAFRSQAVGLASGSP